MESGKERSEDSLRESLSGEEVSQKLTNLVDGDPVFMDLILFLRENIGADSFFSKGDLSDLLKKFFDNKHQDIGNEERFSFYEELCGILFPSNNTRLEEIIKSTQEALDLEGKCSTGTQISGALSCFRDEVMGEDDFVYGLVDMLAKQLCAMNYPFSGGNFYRNFCLFLRSLDVKIGIKSSETEIIDQYFEKVVCFLLSKGINLSSKTLYRVIENKTSIQTRAKKGAVAGSNDQVVGGGLSLNDRSVPWVKFKSNLTKVGESLLERYPELMDFFVSHLVLGFYDIRGDIGLSEFKRVFNTKFEVYKANLESQGYGLEKILETKDTWFGILLSGCFGADVIVDQEIGLEDDGSMIYRMKNIRSIFLGESEKFYEFVRIFVERNEDRMSELSWKVYFDIEMFIYCFFRKKLEYKNRLTHEYGEKLGALSELEKGDKLISVGSLRFRLSEIGNYLGIQDVELKQFVLLSLVPELERFEGTMSLSFFEKVFEDVLQEYLSHSDCPITELEDILKIKDTWFEILVSRCFGGEVKKYMTNGNGQAIEKSVFEEVPSRNNMSIKYVLENIKNLYPGESNEKLYRYCDFLAKSLPSSVYGSIHDFRINFFARRQSFGEDISEAELSGFYAIINSCMNPSFKLKELSIDDFHTKIANFFTVISSEWKGVFSDCLSYIYNGYGELSVMTHDDFSNVFDLRFDEFCESWERNLKDGDESELEELKKMRKGFKDYCMDFLFGMSDVEMWRDLGVDES